ncbi:MAG: GTPase Era [Ruminococcaceae bacterium]|nr:GTPase Era [Oscillospiraceae bacterium]
MFESKLLVAAIVGKPNVGKSTLMNRFIGENLAIISPKPQTTRNRIMGVLTVEELQYLFLDTPGFHKPKNRLGDRMRRSIIDSLDDVDVILFVTYPKEDLDAIEIELLNMVKARETPFLLVINKSDIAKDKEKLGLWEKGISKRYGFFESYSVSALNGENVDSLFDGLEKFAKEGPHLFDEDALTDQPEQFIVAEIMREKLLNNLREELPHGCAVYVEAMKKREKSDIIDISTVIVCEKKSHKGMIIGKGGQQLKKVASQARADIEEFLDNRVNLSCWVKVKEDWRNNETAINEYFQGFN